MAARGASHLLLLSLSLGLIAADSDGAAPPMAVGHAGEVQLLHQVHQVGPVGHGLARQVGHSGHSGLAQALFQLFLGFALTAFYAVVFGVLGVLWLVFGVDTAPLLQPALLLAGVKALAFLAWVN